MKRVRWMWIGLSASLAVGALMSLAASPHPDGLERVAEKKGFLEKTVETPLLRSPLPDYVFPGIADERLARGLAGFLGTLVLFALGYGVGWIVRRAARPRGA
jgi:cobalt/nickel transport protein